MPTLTKAFAAANVGVGQTSTLTFTIANTAAGAVGARRPLLHRHVAGGHRRSPTRRRRPRTTAARRRSRRSTARNPSRLRPSRSPRAPRARSRCTVRGDGPGRYVNGAGQITAISGALNNVTNQTLTVVQASLTKAFTTPVDVNQDSTLTFTLTNGAGNPAQSGINFTDTLPANVVVSPTPAIASTLSERHGRRHRDGRQRHDHGDGRYDEQRAGLVHDVGRRALGHGGTYNNTEPPTSAGTARITTTGVNAERSRCRRCRRSPRPSARRRWAWARPRRSPSRSPIRRVRRRATGLTFSDYAARGRAIAATPKRGEQLRRAAHDHGDGGHRHLHRRRRRQRRGRRIDVHGDGGRDVGGRRAAT